MKISKSVQLGTHIDKHDCLIDLLAFLRERKTKKKKTWWHCQQLCWSGNPVIYIYIYTASLTFNNSTFCLTQLYLCVLCGSENKQRLFLYTKLTGWLCNRDGVCLLRGTDSYYITYVSVQSVPWLSRSVATSRFGPGCIPGDAVWHLWCTQWHWDTFLSEGFGFPCL